MLEGNQRSHINYSKLVDEAMREIAKKILLQVKEEGLKGEHYFIITFLTLNKEVHISQRLLKKYPEEMTIILQHQFESLEIDDEFFTVSLSFDGIRETIKVPFSSLTAIVDPSTKFALQFNSSLYHIDDEQDPLPNSVDDKNLEKKEKLSNKNKVISLDQFRKKKLDV